jgi:hypothetical protein
VISCGAAVGKPPVPVMVVPQSGDYAAFKFPPPERHHLAGCGKTLEQQRERENRDNRHA